MARFTKKDLALLIGLPLLAAIAWLTPLGVWPVIARVTAPFSAPALSRSPGALRTRIRAFMGDHADAAEIAHELAAAEIEMNMQVIRDHLPWRWRPEIEFAGDEHIVQGLGRGRGVILWVSHFYFSSLVTKMALYRAGYRVHHLSDPTHGFSDSQFGTRFLNRICTSAEERYLAARVVMSPEGPRGAMRQLLARLKENGIVSITVRPSGLHPAEVPLFDSHMSVATGAPDLAFASGAALLPVFTVRNADGIYHVNVEKPIVLTGDDRRRASEAAAREYARRLEPYIEAYPGQWTNWISV